MKKYLFAAIAFIFVEIAGFIVVGNWIGLLPTLALIVATTVLGAFVVKKQGTQALQEMRSVGMTQQAPGAMLVDKFLLFLGAILLMLPGFVTDLIGLFLVLPTRAACKPAIFFWLRKKMKHSQAIIVQR